VARNPTWSHGNWRFYNDDGGFGAATPIAGENVIPIIYETRTSAFRIRFAAGDTNNATQNNVRSFRLQCNVDGAGWVDVTATGAIITATDDSGIADGANDANQRLSGLAGSTFQSAWVEFDEDNVLTSRTWADTYTEYEFCLKVGTAVAGNQIDFRMITSSDEAFVPGGSPVLYIEAEPTFVGYSFGIMF